MRLTILVPFCLLTTSSYSFTQITPTSKISRRSSGEILSTLSKNEETKNKKEDEYTSPFPLPNTLVQSALERDVPFGESSRKFRRTLYASDDWVKHRDPDRFFRNLSSLPFAGISVNLFNEIFFITSTAAFVNAFNIFTGDGYIDFQGVHHDAFMQLPKFVHLTMPMDPIKFTASAVGVLLGFRTNTSYQRWNEARSNWEAIVNSSRSIMRIASSWTLPAADDSNKEKRYKLLMEDLARATWSFPRSLRRHLLSAEEDEESFQQDVRDRLPDMHAEKLIAARHRPTRALFDLTNAVDKLPLPFNKRMHIDKNIVVLCDKCGASERIFNSPVPLVYTRITSRLLSVWLFFLPMCLYAPFSNTWNHTGMIPATALISFFFLGVEELAIQLEEPFSILAMTAYTDDIELSAIEYSQWHFTEEFSRQEE